MPHDLTGNKKGSDKKERNVQARRTDRVNSPIASHGARETSPRNAKLNTQKQCEKSQ
jgi:hypothetical protein